MLVAHGFGKLRLTNQNIVVDHFPTRQIEELLGFLLLQPASRHPREKLIAVLWPDISVSQGRHRFSIVLSRLRKLFHYLQTPFEHYIETTREWVTLIPSQKFAFDRDQYVSLCERGFRQEDILAKEQLLQTAVSLYRADLMEGIYTDWCLAEREYLARLRLRVLGQLMYCSMQQQAHCEAIEYGNLILQDDPFREETHRALMQCFDAQNRCDLAAKQYYFYQSLLETELQVPPLPETNQLFVEIMEKRVHQSFSQPTLKYSQKQKIQQALKALQVAAQELETLL